MRTDGALGVTSGNFEVRTGFILLDSSEESIWVHHSLIDSFYSSLINKGTQDECWITQVRYGPSCWITLVGDRVEDLFECIETLKKE